MSRRKPKTARFTFRLEEGLREALEQKAREVGMSPSSAVRNLVLRLARDELRLWPVGVADLRRDPPTEAELLELAEALKATREAVQASARIVEAESESIANKCMRLGKDLRKVGRGASFLDALESLFSFGFEGER